MFRHNAIQYNSVYEVQDGSIVVLFIRDKAKNIIKQNKEVFKKQIELDLSYKNVGPFLCIWEKEDGTRYCKETIYWPTTDSQRVEIGETNQYNHILLSVVNSINK